MTSTKPELRIFDADTYANGDPTTYGLPLDQYAYLQDEEPCYLQEFDDPILLDRAWVVSRHADLWAIDRDAELYAADRGYINMWKFTPIDPVNGGKPCMLTSDGADHRRQRGVVSRGFTPNVVKKLEDRFRGYARSIVDRALERGTFDFARDVAAAMPIQALGDVLGVPEADRVKFFGWVDTFSAPFDTRITPSFEQVIRAQAELTTYATELLELRRREPGDDVISQIVRAGADETLSEDEVMGTVLLLASGAAESTANALSQGMHALLRNPDQMSWLRERSDDVPTTAIQEIVRIASPFSHFVRTATRDHELHGKQIREGDKILMLFVAGNFDPRTFDQPRTFDLGRDPNPHLAFGRGPHSCLGKHVAALEMKLLLEELLQRTTDIEQVGEIDYVRDQFSHGVYKLPVAVTPA
ncbi:cytochrome P450 [Streptomyces hirsutus]|uniref:cytochrome P450 n=1 Tax=Streptomyces hirsutus TaxID=35620 RepID=UPI0036871F24